MAVWRIRCFHLPIFLALLTLLLWQWFYPSSLTPSADDISYCRIVYIILQREDVVRGEGVGQAVEDSTVLAFAGIVTVGSILLAEDVAKETALLLENVFRHHQRKVDDMLRLLLTR